MSDQFSRRQVLPLSEAVRTRFRRRDWERSAQVREILDAINLPQAPRPDVDQHCESIIMSGSEVTNTLRTGSHSVRQHRVTDLPLLTTQAELAIVEQRPFERVVDSTTQSDAAAALAAINDRKPRARRGARLPKKPLKAPRTASTGALVVVILLAVVVAAAWCYVSL